MRNPERHGEGIRDATHDLEFDGLSFQLNSPNLEINTNGRDVALRISVISESKEQAGLFFLERASFS